MEIKEEIDRPLSLDDDKCAEEHKRQTEDMVEKALKMIFEKIDDEVMSVARRTGLIAKGEEE